MRLNGEPGTRRDIRKGVGVLWSVGQAGGCRGGWGVSGGCRDEVIAGTERESKTKEVRREARGENEG